MGSLILAITLAACGGSTNDEGVAPGPDVLPSSMAAARRVVLHHDLDGDRLIDVLTLEVVAAPLRVVEALQAQPDGSFREASASWLGRELEPEIDEALRAYLARSMAVGARSELDVVVDGRLVSLALFE